jgi:AcrR family transcriptional regulator
VRRRDPSRLDTLVAAATSAFVDRGFQRAKIHQIADLASMGPGTVYLYAKDKSALFELVVLRAMESPAVAYPELPYRAHSPAAARKAAFRRALEATIHFPQLWVSLGRREVFGVAAEYRGILLEIASWIIRYGNAIRLAESNRVDWPEIAQFFDDLVWRDVHRHLATYLTTRTHTGHLRSVGEPGAVAGFVIEALVGGLAVRTAAPGSGGLADLGGGSAALAAELLALPLVASGDGPPVPPDSGH